MNYRTQGMVSTGFVGTGSVQSSEHPFFEFTIRGPSTVTWQWGTPDIADMPEWNAPRDLARNLGGSLVDMKRAADGSPVVAYFSPVDGSIKVGMLYDGAWNVSSVHSFDSKIDGEPMMEPGSDLSVAIDSNGIPHVLFYDPASKSLYYAVFAGSNWAVSVLDDEGDPGAHNAIQIAPGNVPHFAYYRAETGSLVYSTLVDNVLATEVVDNAANVGLYVDLALSPRDSNPRLSYYDATHGDLKCAISDGTDWEIHVVDASGDVGIESAIAVDPSGTPLIAYQENTDGAIQGLRFAFLIDGNWQLYNLDETNLTGFGIDLAVDPTGNPHVTYHNFDGLYYAFYNGFNWATVLLQEGELGGTTGLDLDSEGNPGVAYWDGRNLLYVDGKGNSYDLTSSR
ncbi:MAG: hypothetical protein U5N86_04830 [Planctomycetota bacterium]|nr:hypothetical protein [Planctomycetota bacterium]